MQKKKQFFLSWWCSDSFSLWNVTLLFSSCEAGTEMDQRVLSDMRWHQRHRPVTHGYQEAAYNILVKTSGDVTSDLTHIYDKREMPQSRHLTSGNLQPAVWPQLTWLTDPICVLVCFSWPNISPNNRCSTNAGLRLGQRRRRWANTNSALVQYRVFVFAYLHLHVASD